MRESTYAADGRTRCVAAEFNASSAQRVRRAETNRLSEKHPPELFANRSPSGVKPLLESKD